MLFPVIWMLETALKDTKDIYAVPAKVITLRTPTLDHFKDVFSSDSPVFKGFKNSVIVAGASTIIATRARRARGVGLLALPDQGQEGPAVLHPLDALHAARRGRDPGLPDVPRPQPAGHAARA